MKNAFIIVLLLTIAWLAYDNHPPENTESVVYIYIPSSVINSDGYVTEEWLRAMLLYHGVKDVDKLISIAKRESRLMPHAYNSKLNKDGSHDVGLFQINSKAWPELWSKYNLLDPEENVKAAVEIYNSVGLKPWRVWT